jgi:hypothetical protein
MYDLPDSLLLDIIPYFDISDIMRLNNIDKFNELFNKHFILPNKQLILMNNSCIDMSNNTDKIDEYKWLPIKYIYKLKCSVIVDPNIITNVAILDLSECRDYTHYLNLHD